jgi:hypothetical protein
MPGKNFRALAAVVLENWYNWCQKLKKAFGASAKQHTAEGLTACCTSSSSCKHCLHLRRVLSHSCEARLSLVRQRSSGTLVTFHLLCAISILSMFSFASDLSWTPDKPPWFLISLGSPPPGPLQNWPSVQPLGLIKATCGTRLSCMHNREESKILSVNTYRSQNVAVHQFWKSRGNQNLVRLI